MSRRTSPFQVTSGQLLKSGQGQHRVSLLEDHLSRSRRIQENLSIQWAYVLSVNLQELEHKENSLLSSSLSRRIMLKGQLRS